MNLNKNEVIRRGQAVLEVEAQAISALTKQIDDAFFHAVEKILACSGRIVVTGMGKSGHIGGKIAATLASTGTPSFFVHPGEASHGDLGMITAKDLVIALSNSGETSEVLTLLPVIKRLGVPLIAMTGSAASTLAKKADIFLNVAVAKEACPLDLAPTASTTAALAMGDALAVALLESRGFTSEDFALSHPGGSLGKRLLLTVNDLMHADADLPKVDSKTTIASALIEMSAKRLGLTTVFKNGQCIGIFTDGDLRRAIEANVDFHGAAIEEAMTRNLKTIPIDALAAEAVQMMQTHRINALIVVDDNGNAVGALNMHDLLRAGVV